MKNCFICQCNLDENAKELYDPWQFTHIKTCDDCFYKIITSVRFLRTRSEIYKEYNEMI